jgi:hypothetical protein
MQQRCPLSEFLIERKEGTKTMKKAACLLALCFVAGAARASPPLFSPGISPPNVGGSDREALWSEPADLNGLIGSSDQILAFGLESECANDFVPVAAIGSAVWWGGFYYCNTPCASGITTPGFNLRFYQDAGSTPGVRIADLSFTYFSEVFVGCQSNSYPLFRWSAYVGLDLVAGNRYWFGAQMKDHAFPPTAGRLASAGVVGCDSAFRSPYFAFPDWTPAIDVFGVPVDFSQEFYCMICDENAGVDDTPPTRATERASWGRVKGLYR